GVSGAGGASSAKTVGWAEFKGDCTLIRELRSERFERYEGHGVVDPLRFSCDQRGCCRARRHGPYSWRAPAPYRPLRAGWAIAPGHSGDRHETQESPREPTEPTKRPTDPDRNSA